MTTHARVAHSIPRYFAAAGGSGFSAAMLALSPLVYARCGEASGTTMVDSSGNSHNGTWAGAPSFGTAGLLAGDSDKAVILDGSGLQYAEVASGSWANVSHFTVAALIKTTATATSAILDRHKSSTGGGFQFRMESNGKIGFYLVSGGGVLGSFATSPSAVNDGNKHFVVGTCDGANLIIYVDGTAVATVANTNGQPSVTDGLRLGLNRATAADGGANGFGGVLDEVAYIGSAISATDVANLWALV